MPKFMTPRRHTGSCVRRKKLLLSGVLGALLLFLGVTPGAGCASQPAGPNGQDNAEAPQQTEHRGGQFELADSETIPVADSPIRGDENAWVTVVVFADFQSPFCGRVAATLDEVLEEYQEGTVRLVFKHFPMADHQGAKPAARAAEAARNQEKFWEMREALFDEVAGLRSDDPESVIVEAARVAEVDVEQLRDDMDRDAVAARIDEDRQLGDQLGLDSAPAVFVSGGYIPGARAAQVYHDAIQSVYDILHEAVLIGDVDRSEVYSHSVQALYDHTTPGRDRSQRPPAPVMDVPVRDRPTTADVEDALVQAPVFIDLC